MVTLVREQESVLTVMADERGVSVDALVAELLSGPLLMLSEM